MDGWMDDWYLFIFWEKDHATVTDKVLNERSYGSRDAFVQPKTTWRNELNERSMVVNPFLTGYLCSLRCLYIKPYKHSWKAVRNFTHSSARLDGPLKDKVRAIPFSQHVKAAEQVMFKDYVLKIWPKLTILDNLTDIWILPWSQFLFC
jgi:hypothetical protein